MAAPKQKGLSVQEASQCLAIVVLGLPRHAGIRRTIEAVIRPRIHMQLDRYPGAAQSIRIGQVFFKEEIETADRNVGCRQARHIRRARSRPRTAAPSANGCTRRSLTRASAKPCVIAWVRAAALEPGGICQQRRGHHRCDPESNRWRGRLAAVPLLSFISVCRADHPGRGHDPESASLPPPRSHRQATAVDRLPRSGIHEQGNRGIHAHFGVHR